MAQELLPGIPADPGSVRQEVERLRKSETELAALRPREAKLQTALAEKNLENLELRWRVAAAREATNPSLAQVLQPCSLMKPCVPVLLVTQIYVEQYRTCTLCMCWVLLCWRVSMSGSWQARQLLTDPAVAREFARLREEAEAKAQEVRRLQEELQAVNFSQESKAGRLLMAKCRALQVLLTVCAAKVNEVRCKWSGLATGSK